MWFKEYTFNVIIQPFHFLIYTVLIGAAMDLARVSLIYSVVALYFLIPAEKLLRKFFGFDNAGTLSAAGSFAGGALFSSMIGKLNRPKPPEPRDDGEKAKNQRKNTSSRLVNADKAILGDAANVNIDEANGQSGAGGRWPAEEALAGSARRTEGQQIQEQIN